MSELKWDPMGNTLHDLKLFVDKHQGPYNKELHIILLEENLWCIEQIAFNKLEVMNARLDQIESYSLHLAQLGARYNFVNWVLQNYRNELESD